MSLIFAEGFGFSTNISDYMSYKGYQSAGGGTLPIVPTSGPLGDNYLRVNGNGGGSGPNSVVFPPFTANATVTIGCRIQITFATGGTGALLDFVSPNANTQIRVVANAQTGQLQVFRGPGTTLLGSCVVSNFSAWNYLEFQMTISTTVGTFILKQNNVILLNLSGVNTANDTSNQTVSQLIADANFTGGGGWEVGYAHIYVTDQTAPNAGFLGDVRVYTQEPTANAVVAFTPSGLANNFQNAAKTPPAPATDFNGSSTAGQTDLFTGSAVPLTFTDIFAIGVEVLWGKSDSGARTVASEVSSSATVANGATITPVTTPSFAVQQDWFQVDPHTAGNWTQTAVNAVEFGYKVVT